MQYVVSIVIPIVTALLAAWSTYYFTARHFHKQKWFEFDQRRFDEFYGPILNLIQQIRADCENSVKVSDASNQVWQEICQKHSHPFEDCDKYFEPYKKILDDENTRMNNNIVPTLDELVNIFKSKEHLAYPSTQKLLPQFLLYVEQFHRQLPREVFNKIYHSAEPLAKLYADVETHANKLRIKLSGEKQ